LNALIITAIRSEGCKSHVWNHTVYCGLQLFVSLSHSLS